MGPLARLLGHVLDAGLDLPEPEAHARRLHASQRVLMVTATDDERIPARASEALWKALVDSDARVERMDLPGRHLRGYGDPAIDEILGHAIDWLDRNGLLATAAETPLKR